MTETDAKLIQSIKHCVRYGDYTLHAGGKSTWICDLLQMRDRFQHLVSLLSPNYPLVGIEFGGALLAMAWSPGRCGIIRKDGKAYPWFGLSELVSLVDDVVTTEESLHEATRVILETQHSKVAEYLCILDRRKPEHRTLEVRSLVTAAGLGLAP